MKIDDKDVSPGVSIVVPCYNEEGAVAETIEDLDKVLKAASDDGLHPGAWEVVFVNDGSKDKTGEILDKEAESHPWMKVLHNHRNRGYGASLKRGILEADYEKIVITDADGTYPNERIPELVQRLDEVDMIIGARTGANVSIPLVRRPVKWLLTKYACWMSGANIEDLNSGLRGMRRHKILEFWNMLPNAFSFTSTITIAMHISDSHVEYVPIDYHRRVGQSSIKPIRDTARFFLLVLRTVMYFRPLQVFGAVGVALILASIAVGVVGLLVWNDVPDVSALSLFSTGVLLCGFGLLGDLVNARRP